MNNLITGANGQLGNEMQLVSKKSKGHYIFTDVCDGYQKLDITDFDAIRKMVKEKGIEKIVRRYLDSQWINNVTPIDYQKY